ncbi:MAG TPA: hypothetical protein DCY02_02790, partial [Armatimonadetes bacterium]|nr:hypothetical protein [Armatimonadota bacterium]
MQRGRGDAEITGRFAECHHRVLAGQDGFHQVGHLLGVEKQFEPNYVARSYRCVELFRHGGRFRHGQRDRLIVLDFLRQRSRGSRGLHEIGRA